MKRTVAFLLTLALLVSCFALMPTKVQASYTMGDCGNNLTWELDKSTGFLTISGTGDMYDYSDDNPAGWTRYKNNINFIYMEDGITSIGDYAFAHIKPTRINIASTVREIGSHALSGCTHNIRFMCPAPKMADDACANMSVRAYYVGGWSDADLRGYGGTLTWEKATTVRMSKASKMFYQIGEPLKAENFVLNPSFGSDAKTFTYTPSELIAEYDNSTLGKKTVTVDLDGYKYTYTYYVIAHKDPRQLIEISYEPIQYYKGGRNIQPKVTVTVDGHTLSSGVHYTLTYKNCSAVGTSGQITVTGLGEFAGYERVLPVAILKSDISTSYFTLPGKDFVGAPITQAPTSVNCNGHQTSSYTPMYDNNINIGAARVHLIGTDNYYGRVTGGFAITADDAYLTLPGAYNGQADGTLNDQVAYIEGVLPPVMFTGRLDESYQLSAYYILYRIEGDDAVIVEEYETEVANASQVPFTYDFRPVYENADGGEVYLLAYSWVNIYDEVYSGALIVAVPAKVPSATYAFLEQAEGDGDFRCEYFGMAGMDGVVENITWSTSDSTIATVEDGIVTLKQPGTVTVTGQSGTLSASTELTVQALNMEDAVIFDYDDGVSNVIYEGRLLEEGTDYTLSATEEDGVTTVTVTGCGLFSGQLTEIIEEYKWTCSHSYGYEDNADGTHDHLCTVCGELVTENEAHTYTNGSCACGAAEPTVPAELIKWAGSNVTLGGALAMNFAFDTAQLGGTTGNYIALTRSYADGREDDVVTIPQSEWVSAGGSFIQVSYTNMAAKEMGDKITAVVYNAKGQVISETRTDSMAEYSARMLVKNDIVDSAEKRTLFVDMLNYGAAAQVYFGYDAENLVNATLTAEQASWASAAVQIANYRQIGGCYVGSNLSLEEEIYLQVAFNAVCEEGMYAVVSFTDHYGKPVEKTVAVEASGSFTVVRVEGMAIADYRGLVTCKLYSAAGAELGSVTDSIESYACRMAIDLQKNGVDLGDVIMKLGASSYEFFH